MPTGIRLDYIEHDDLNIDLNNLLNNFEVYSKHLELINKQFVNANVIDNIVDFHRK